MTVDKAIKVYAYTPREAVEMAKEILPVSVTRSHDLIVKRTGTHTFEVRI